MQGSSAAGDRVLLDAAALCGHVVPGGSVYAFLAEHRGRIFPDELFADLFPSGRGRPSVPADVIATAFVLKELEGLSDRQAAAALATDIRWKAAAGLPLDDAGFDASVFVYWRRRLNASGRPHRIDEAVKDVAAQTGVLNGRARRALDSTVFDDAVATQDTVTQLVAAIRKVRKLVPAAREVQVSAHDYDRGGKPDIAWDNDVARDALVSALVTDALAIIDCLPVTGLDDGQERAVACWRWSPARTSNPASSPGRGGSPAPSPRTGWCRRSIPSHDTRTRPDRRTATARRTRVHQLRPIRRPDAPSPDAGQPVVDHGVLSRRHRCACGTSPGTSLVCTCGW